MNDIKKELAQSEEQRLAAKANWYLQEQLNFDKRLIRFRYETLKPHFHGSHALELGSAEGEMTQFLVPHFENLVIVDGAADLLAHIPQAPNMVKVHALFEEFEPEHGFDTIIMEHILEHVEHPVALLQRAKQWLNPEGKLLLSVPNAHSFHRLAAVKMGLLKTPYELNARDHAVGHRRVYDWQTFRSDIESAGLHIQEMGGVFFKPLSNGQIQNHWTEEMIQGFYELGKDFPENAAVIYTVCEGS